MKRLIATILLPILVFGIFTTNVNALSISSEKTDGTEGNYLIRIKDSTEPLKAEVVFGENTYTYELKEGDNYLPLQFGNGEYKFTIFQNIKANIYKKVGFKTIEVSENNNPFLSNNVIIDDTYATKTIKKVEKLITKEMKTEEKVNTIYNFVIESLSYDFMKDQNKLNVMIDETFESGKGSSYDYALSTVVLLRHFNIPAKLVLGNHKDCDTPTAWVEVKVNDNFRVLDPVYERTEKYRPSGNYEKYLFY